MFQSNKVYLLQAQARAAAELAAIQAEETAAEAAFLATALTTPTIGAPTSAAQLVGDLYNHATDLAGIAERQRIAEARSLALDTLVVAFDAEFA
jgi:hypothetical protein